MRCADFGPTPGNRPSSSMRSWTAPSYTSALVLTGRPGPTTRVHEPGPAGARAAPALVRGLTAARRTFDAAARRCRSAGEGEAGRRGRTAAEPGPFGSEPRNTTGQRAHRTGRGLLGVLGRVTDGGDDQVGERLGVVRVDGFLLDRQAQQLAGPRHQRGHQPTTGRALDLLTLQVGLSL